MSVFLTALVTAVVVGVHCPRVCLLGEKDMFHSYCTMDGVCSSLDPRIPGRCDNEKVLFESIVKKICTNIKDIECSSGSKNIGHRDPCFYPTPQRWVDRLYPYFKTGLKRYLQAGNKEAEKMQHYIKVNSDQQKNEQKYQKEVMDQITELLHEHLPDKIDHYFVIIFGPSAVGKSTLQNTISEFIFEKNKKEKIYINDGDIFRESHPKMEEIRNLLNKECLPALEVHTISKSETKNVILEEALSTKSSIMIMSTLSHFDSITSAIKTVKQINEKHSQYGVIFIELEVPGTGITGPPEWLQKRGDERAKRTGKPYSPNSFRLYKAKRWITKMIRIFSAERDLFLTLKYGEDGNIHEIEIDDGEGRNVRRSSLRT